MPATVESLRDRAEAAEQRLRLAVANAKGRQLRALEKGLKERGERSRARRGYGGGYGGPVALSGGYEAASRTRMSSGRLRLRAGSVDSFLDPTTLDYLRRDGRALMRNNPIARGMVRRCIDMIAGGRGFTAHAASEDPAWNKLADAWWDEYWHDKARCDARRLMNGDEMVRAVVRQVLIDGDVLAVPQDYGYLQFVDADRIINPAGLANSDGLVNGVEVDKLGMPAKFHVASYRFAGQALDRATVAFDAETSWYLVRPEWMSQTRGEPRLGAVSDKFDQITDFVDAVLTAAQTAAMFTGIITQQDPGQTVLGLPSTTQTSDTDGSAQDVVDIEPGSMMRLKTGESLTQMDGKHPNATFESFLINLVRIVGQDLDLPLEVALLHFGLTVFASAKASLTVCLRSIDSWQEWLIQSLLKPWWKWRIAMAILDGELPANAQYNRVAWTPPAKPNLDPQQKATTDATLVGAKMKTRAKCAAEDGDDWEQLIRQCAAEDALIKELGLTIAPMPGAGATVGAPAPGQPGQPGQPDTAPDGDEPADGSGGGAGAAAPALAHA